MGRLIFICLLLTGCSIFHAPNPVPTVDAIVATVMLTEDLPPFIMGEAHYGGAVCQVKIRKSNYPNCLTHELRHCFEGKWHDDRPNQEDCFVKEKK